MCKLCCGSTYSLFQIGTLSETEVRERWKKLDPNILNTLQSMGSYHYSNYDINTTNINIPTKQNLAIYYHYTNDLYPCYNESIIAEIIPDYLNKIDEFADLCITINE